jgi:hypothetical protein
MDYLVQPDKISPAAAAHLADGRPPPNIVLAKSTEKISPLAGQPPPTKKFSPEADHGCSLLFLALALAQAQVLKSQVTRTPHAAYDGEPVYKEQGWRRERMRCSLDEI